MSTIEKATARPMRLAKRQVTDNDAVESIVSSCNVIRIGCADDEGMFIVPMNFGYEWDVCETPACANEASGDIDAGEGIADAPATNANDRKPDDTSSKNDAAASTRANASRTLTLWLHCAQVGRKADAFAKTPRVAIEMDCEDGLISGSYACAYSFAYRSIMGTGRVMPVPDAASKRHALTKIMEHVAPGAPITYSNEAIERVAVYRIDVDTLTAKQRAPKTAQR